LKGPYTVFALEYRGDLVDILEDRGVYVKLNPNDLDEYFQAIDAADASLAYQRLTLETLTNEYTSYLANRANQTLDKSYFLKTLRRLARFNHVTVIRPESITVEEFVIMLGDWLDYLNTSKKQLEPDGD
jgi:hypothetical protein